MFFILSKVLFFLICPIIWVCVMLAAAVLTHNPRTRKRLLVAVLSILYLFSIPLLLNQFARLWDIPPTTLPATQKFSCAIILGGFSSADENGDGFFNSAADRFIEGVKLKNTGAATHLLISGGNGNLQPGKFREATWVKTQLQQFNIPDSSIIIESRSRNTIENAAYSKLLLQQHHLAPPYLLVTSAFHMRRSLGIFKRAGVAVVPYPCNYLSGRENASFSQLIPDADTFSKWTYYIKEVIGVAVNYVKK